MKEAGRHLWDLRTPVRDGVELSADVYLPPAGLTGGPYPLVLLRTPDNNQQAGPVALARHLSDEGYAVALQDVRGRHDSQGRFTPFVHEGADGYDSVEWFAGQPWCTGRVAMMGSGYAARAQWAAAAERPPSLVTLVSTSPMSGPYRNGMLRLAMLAWLHKVAGRVWQEASQVDWDAVLTSLPLGAMDCGMGRQLPVWHEWLADPDAVPELAPVDLPVLHVTGWYDDEQPHALRLHAQQGAGSALLVGPWDGSGTSSPRPSLGGVDFGAGSVADLAAAHLTWFDQWLRDAPREVPPARVFVTGAGEWRDLAGWPPAATATSYALRSDGRLSLAAAGEEAPDRYDADPADPVVMTSDLRLFPTPPARPVEPPLDRRFVERRDDVLVYTSDELAEDLEVLGSPAVRLFVSSDRPSTDWVVSVTDVSPRGPSVLVADGVLRADLPPGEVVEVSLDLGAAAHVFARGHRVRLSVTGSAFPFYSRNLHTGGPIAAETELRVARNSLFHDPAHPSALVLPVGDRRG